MSVPNDYLSKGTSTYYAALLALFFAGLASFSLLHCVQPMMPVLAEFFSITPTQSSFALSVSTLSLAFGLLITGFISDVVGRKSIMVFGLITASVLTILSSFIPSWSFFLLSRVAVGFAVSGVAAVAMTYIGEEVRPIDIAATMGLYIAGTAIGGMSGRVFTGILSDTMDWHHVLLLLGSMNLLLALLFAYLLPDSRNFKPTLFSLSKLRQGFRRHLYNAQLRILFVQGFIVMGCLVTVYNYLNYYLLAPPFAVSQSTLGLLAFAYLSGIYSSPRAAYWSEKWGRKRVLILMLSVMLVALWLMTLVTQFWLLCIGLLLFTFAFFAAHSTASSWVSRTAQQQRAVAASLYLCSYYLGSSLLGSSNGLVWEYAGWAGLSISITITLCIGLFLASRLHEFRD